MNGLLESFSSMGNGKAAVATITMVTLTAIIIFVIFIIYKYFTSRKEVMAIKLPEIDDNQSVMLKDPVFAEAPITVELLDPIEEDQMVSSSPSNGDGTLFIKALSQEAGRLIVDEENNLKMPVVEEMDYDKKSEEIKLQREREEAERLKKLAEADGEDGEILLEIQKSINNQV